jgi:hypothetical protein
MREEEDGLPRSDAITISFVEDLESLAPQACSYCSQCLNTCTRDQDTTKHTSTNSIIKSNLLNRSRSIKINDALTYTFMENEPTVVYINRNKGGSIQPSLDVNKLSLSECPSPSSSSPSTPSPSQMSSM